MPSKEVSFQWRDGYIIVTGGDDELVVEASNSRVTFSLREVSVQGLFQGVREHLEGSRGERKAVYIDLAFPLKGLAEPRGVVFKNTVDTYMGSYGLSYTVIKGIGYYLTIYPPPGGLYDHAVLAEDLILLYTLARRQIYQMREDSLVKIILV